MKTKNIHAVTGAFGYSGRYIAKRLIENGNTVRTLTNSTHKNNPFGNLIDVRPLNFRNQSSLANSLQDVEVLYNTYWVRFNHRNFTHSEATDNTITLFEAAKEAGVGRIVHISITNPDPHSALEYFRGKGELEDYLKNSGVPYSILRPTVLFGKEDILINNIAWMLRKFPVFAVFGKGDYRIQPVFVDDLAALAVEQGKTDVGNEIINATGPETYTYLQLVKTIMAALGLQRRIIHISPGSGYLAGKIISSFVGDVVITRPEIEGLMSGLLCTDSPPACPTKFSEWIACNSKNTGTKYTGELARRK
ncbi:MAG: NAD(P)H-binding protein [Bacteroidetes bacterium]|nr:NAD(P)H-binding protein [Bacteroidota bacterium]